MQTEQEPVTKQCTECLVYYNNAHPHKCDPAVVALIAKRKADQARMNAMPEDESDGPNVCIACQ